MEDEDRVSVQIASGARAAEQLVRERRRLLAPGARPRPGILLAEGDSWFDYPLTDVLSALEDHFGWEIESAADRGDNLESMAYGQAQRERFTRVFERVERRGEVPVAIVLSGGGNEFAGPELAVMLDHMGTGHGGINELITTELVQRRMREAWANLLGFTRQLAVELFGVPVRTVVHGYDYAVPDGRGFLGGAGVLPGPWLAPSYARKGIGSDSQEGLEERAALTRVLLDRYNGMLEFLVTAPGLEHVTYVDLRGVLTSPDYKDDWANELHPTASGFRAIASRINDALQA